MKDKSINYTTKNTSEVIKSAVDKLVGMVSPTYGPSNNKVIIDKMIYHHVIDDGVQIARDFELSDPMENAVLKKIKEVAIKTNDRAGDGTTGSLLVLKGILDTSSKTQRKSGREIEIELKYALQEAKFQLIANSKTISKTEDIKKVALTSHDDENTADMIASLYKDLGKNGVITVDKSPTLETYFERSDGLKIDSGYISRYMVADPERNETEMEKPYILITDYRLTESNDILPIMNKMVQAGKRNLIVIAENVEQNALATLVTNLPQVFNTRNQKAGEFPSVAVAAPKSGDKKQLLEDLALMTGAKMFSESKGSNLENVELNDLGQAGKVICREDETIIVEPKGAKKDIKKAISDLESSTKNEKDLKKKEKKQKRLGMIKNSIAVIKVGAYTDVEQKSLKYKIEDAVYSVRSALKNGVSVGSGLALARIETSSTILNEALKYPHSVLMRNVGRDDEIISHKTKKDYAINVVTNQTGNFLEVGVVDPTDVLLAGLESAISMASILLTSSGIYVETPKEENVKN